jgi:hypothetical protein
VLAGPEAPAEPLVGAAAAPVAPLVPEAWPARCWPSGGRILAARTARRAMAVLVAAAALTFSIVVQQLSDLVMAGLPPDAFRTSVWHCWGSRGRRFESCRPDGTAGGSPSAGRTARCRI